MRFIGFAIFVAVGLLQGCTIAKQFAEGVRCDGYCVEDFPGAQMNADRRLELVLLPPLHTLSVRDGQHEETERLTGLDPALGQVLQDNLWRAANAYGIDMRYQPDAIPAPLSATQLLAWHNALWVQEADPEALRDSTPLAGLGAPEIIDPKATSRLELGEISREMLGNACCVLLVRVNGWRYTRAVASGKTAVAIGFSALPGGSGYIPPTSDVVADAAVVRLDDGAVIWSSRYIGPTAMQRMRHLFLPYLSNTSVNNDRLARSTATP